MVVVLGRVVVDEVVEVVVVVSGRVVVLDVVVVGSGSGTKIVVVVVGAGKEVDEVLVVPVGGEGGCVVCGISVFSVGCDVGGVVSTGRVEEDSGTVGSGSVRSTVVVVCSTVVVVSSIVVVGSG